MPDNNETIEMTAEAREAELLKREEALARRELMAEAAVQLAQRELPAELSAALDYTNAESCMASIENVERAFKDAVQRGIASKLRAGGALPAAYRKDLREMSDDEYYHTVMGR